jgi:hypothetical protein
MIEFLFMCCLYDSTTFSSINNTFSSFEPISYDNLLSMKLSMLLRSSILTSLTLFDSSLLVEFIILSIKSANFTMLSV